MRGDWISSASSFDRIAQIPHVTIVTNVQPSQRAMTDDYSKTLATDFSCAKCLSICAKRLLIPIVVGSINGCGTCDVWLES